MELTIHVNKNEGNVYISGLTLIELLSEVFQSGIAKGKEDTESDLITFQQLSKELKAKGRTITVQTLTKKAREANVEVVRFDGKRLGTARKNLKHFLSDV